jgi:hypothetical protein
MHQIKVPNLPDKRNQRPNLADEPEHPRPFVISASQTKMGKAVPGSCMIIRTTETTPSRSRVLQSSEL